MRGDHTLELPAAMITRKVAPALAAGCTIIVKPARQTPLSALALGELAQRAGVPAGVFSVLTGPARAIGGVLTASMAVRKLTFTGSTEVGRVLAAQCAPTLKKMSLELGGNAPSSSSTMRTWMPPWKAPWPPSTATPARPASAPTACWYRTGVRGLHGKLKAAVLALKVGNGADAGITQGPLIDEAAVAKVKELVADAVAQGAEVVTGGKPSALGGTFYEPTILGGATDRMRIAREEVFGPVAPVFRFSTEEEAIRMANDTEYGLAAYFYARDVGRVWRVGAALEYGMVGINSGIISTAVAPFGGVKVGHGPRGWRRGD